MKRPTLSVCRRWLIALLAVLLASTGAYAASVDGIDIHSTSAGSGPTIIFVHGWTCDTSSWRDQIPAFDDDYRVIALDLPGHGQSGAPDGAEVFSMDLFARAVEAVRAEAGADEVVLVGHSMGVAVIRQYATTWPDRVAGLVAVDGPIDVRNFGFGVPAGFDVTTEMREGMIRGMFVPETPADLQEHILDMMLGAPAETASGAMAAMFGTSTNTDTVIEAPTLAVVAGTAQTPDTAAIREIVPNFEGARLAGTGHFLMMEKPAEFNALLADFLDEIGY